MVSEYYDASFAGVDFWEQGASYPDRPVTTEGGVTGDTFTDLGAGAEPFEVAAAVEQAEYADLLTRRGDVGTLVFSGSAGVTVKLLAIRDRPGLAQPWGVYSVSLLFQP